MILAMQQLAQRRTSHKLHYDIRWCMHVVSLAEVMNRDDVWMSQHRRRASFTAKPRQRRVVFDKLAGQNLHRHVVADVYASSAIDHAHATFTETRQQFVLAIDTMTDQWIRIGEANRGQGRVEMIFVVGVCSREIGRASCRE